VSLFNFIKNKFNSKDEQQIIKGNVADSKKQESEIIYSPLNGGAKALSEVNDPTFAQELMGKGIAIEPSEGKVVSPVKGEVAAIFATKHAIALKSENGAEILIHIGIDTVALEGKHFVSHINQGDNVNIGDLLVEFDIEAIKNEGYDVITSIIITNTDDYSDIKKTDSKRVLEKDMLIEVIA